MRAKSMAPRPAGFGPLLPPSSALALFVLGCATPPPASEPEPLGELPNVSTTAQAIWVPFRVRSGESFPPMAAEQRLDDLRRLTKGQRTGRVAWSPDGRLIAFETTPAASEENACPRVAVFDLTNGDNRVVSEPTHAARHPAFDADGTLLYARHAECSASPPAAGFEIVRARIETNAPPQPLVRWTGSSFAIAVGPDHRYLFSVAADRDVELYGMGAGEPNGSPQRVTSVTGLDSDPTWAPDGGRFAWVATRPTGSAKEAFENAVAKGLPPPAHAGAVRVGTEPGTPGVVVTDDARQPLAPHFLPDGQHLLFTRASLDGRHADLFLVDVDAPLGAGGVPPSERVTFHTGRDAFGAVSPDGTHVAFSSNRGSNVDGALDLYVARWSNDID